MNKNIEKIIDDIYKELYENSLSIDESLTFDQLANNAVEIEDKRQKMIPFMSFYISEEDFKGIVEKHLKHKQERTKKAVEFNVYLGPSPTSNRERWEKLKQNYLTKINEKDWSNMKYTEIFQQTQDKDLTDALVFFSRFKKK